MLPAPPCLELIEQPESAEITARREASLVPLRKYCASPVATIDSA
jgi:hypothetical protein